MTQIKAWKPKKTLTLANIQNPLKTSLINLILSNSVDLEPTLNLTKDWPSLIDFNEVSLIWLLSSHNLTVWLSLSFTKSNISLHSTNPTAKFWISIWLHDRHVLLYPPTRKLWWTPLTQSDHPKWLKYAINLIDTFPTLSI